SPLEVKKHIGQTITFRGVFYSDNLERSVIWPDHCRRAWVGAGYPMTPQAGKALEGNPLSPFTKVHAVITGTLRPDKVNTFLSLNGVRLDFIRVKPIPRKHKRKHKP